VPARGRNRSTAEDDRSRLPSASMPIRAAVASSYTLASSVSSTPTDTRHAATLGWPEVLPHPIALAHLIRDVHCFVQVCMRFIGALLPCCGSGLLKVHHADHLGG